MAALSLTFVKASGAGNDFVLLDNMDHNLTLDQPSLAQTLCDRHLGIGADGMIVLEPSSRGDFRMMYYNADGSYGGMCGNGGRCAVLVALKRGLTSSTFSFEAVEHLYTGSVRSNVVRMQMKTPYDIRRPVTITVGVSGVYECHYLDTGSPHVVCFVDSVHRINVVEVGRALREHAAFAPGGANINFLQVTDGNTIRMRTYERGVEAETLACGTGALACSIVASRLRDVRSPVNVLTTSGACLTVHFARGPEGFTKLELEGPADILFEGKVLIDPISCRIVPL
jgi:diaminopimelate epimerase